MRKQQQQQPTKTKTITTALSSSLSLSSFPYEFGGPIGTGITILLLPLIVLLLAHWSHVGTIDFTFMFTFVNQFHFYLKQQHDSSLLLSYGNAFYKSFIESSVLCPGCSNSTSNNNIPMVVIMMGIVISWFLFQVFLERLLPCELVQGCPIQKRKCDDNNKEKNKNNKTSSSTSTSSSSISLSTFRLTYRINGHLAFWVTFLIINFGYPYWHIGSQSIQFTSFPIELLYQYYSELALATIILSFALSFYLYLHSFASNNNNEYKILAVGGNSGNVIYDFFMGRELNPRIGGNSSSSLSSSCSFDWKEFCELRPGLIGWVLLNMGCMKQQYIINDGYVSGSMILINIFQGFYVWDALYQERAILSTMDITTDGFGYMLVFGDLCWVPFTYSLQARYLVYHDPHLSLTTLTLIVVLHMIGYYIFRSANAQKDTFRRGESNNNASNDNDNDDDPASLRQDNLQYLQTKRGTKLLTSGWWGMARKINYTGDWIMGLSWCMVCGFDSIVPYYYAIYFMILLIHRSIRDDHMCQAKYGDDWDVYKKIVPYRFIPGVV